MDQTIIFYVTGSYIADRTGKYPKFFYKGFRMESDTCSDFYLL